MSMLSYVDEKILQLHVHYLHFTSRQNKAKTMMSYMHRNLRTLQILRTLQSFYSKTSNLSMNSCFNGNAILPLYRKDSILTSTHVTSLSYSISYRESDGEIDELTPMDIDDESKSKRAAPILEQSVSEPAHRPPTVCSPPS